VNFLVVFSRAAWNSSIQQGNINRLLQERPYLEYSIASTGGIEPLFELSSDTDYKKIENSKNDQC
jgi:hypothetical protein